MGKYSSINTGGLSSAVSMAKKELNDKKNRLQNISGNLSQAVSVNVTNTVTNAINSLVSSGASGTLSTYEKNLNILSEGIKLIEDYQKIEREYERLERQGGRNADTNQQALRQLKSEMQVLDSRISSKFNSGSFGRW